MRPDRPRRARRGRGIFTAQVIVPLPPLEPNFWYFLSFYLWEAECSMWNNRCFKTKCLPPVWTHRNPRCAASASCWLRGQDNSVAMPANEGCSTVGGVIAVLRIAAGKAATISLFLVSRPFGSAALATPDISITSTRLGETILKRSKVRKWLGAPGILTHPKSATAHGGAVKKVPPLFRGRLLCGVSDDSSPRWARFWNL